MLTVSLYIATSFAYADTEPTEQAENTETLEQILQIIYPRSQAIAITLETNRELTSVDLNNLNVVGQQLPKLKAALPAEDAAHMPFSTALGFVAGFCAVPNSLALARMYAAQGVQPDEINEASRVSHDSAEILKSIDEQTRTIKIAESAITNKPVIHDDVTLIGAHQCQAFYEFVQTLNGTR